MNNATKQQRMEQRLEPYQHTFCEWCKAPKYEKWNNCGKDRCEYLTHKRNRVERKEPGKTVDYKGQVIDKRVIPSSDVR